MIYMNVMGFAVPEWVVATAYIGSLVLFAFGGLAWVSSFPPADDGFPRKLEEPIEPRCWCGYHADHVGGHSG